MQLRAIEIQNLRNINKISTEFPRGSIFIHGKNGQGKTSIVEAIFLLSHARSFRTSSIKDLVTMYGTGSESGKKTNSEVHVRGIIENALGSFELGISIKQGKRELLVNGKKVQNAADFCGRLKTVLFTPEDLELVKGAPLLRRQFLDRILVMLEPSIMNDLGEYTKILKNRNTLLAAGDHRKAKIFDSLLLEKNYLLIHKRSELLKKISENARKIYTKVAGTQNEEMHLEYKSALVKEGKVVTKEEAQKIFEASFERDLKTGRTNIGIHRDEIMVKFTSEFAHGLSRIVSSQGQIRCVSLCCKLASAEYIKEKTEEAPLLLLDDMDSELDEDRRNALFELIKAYEGQIFLTGTRAPLESEKTQVLTVSAGKLGK